MSDDKKPHSSGGRSGGAIIGGVIMAIFVGVIVLTSVTKNHPAAPTPLAPAKPTAPQQQAATPPAQNPPSASVQKASDGGSNTQASQTTYCLLSSCGGTGHSAAEFSTEAVSTDNQTVTAPHLRNVANPEAEENWTKIPIPKHYSVYVEGLTGPNPPDPRLRAECLGLFGTRTPWSQNCTGTDILVGSNTSEDIPLQYKFTPE